MKWRGRRQSDMVQIQSPDEKKKADKVLAMDAKMKANPRTINEGEPIAYAEKTTTDRALGAINNPGRKSAATKRETMDPAPQKMQKVKDGELSRSTYDDLPFLEHTVKENK